jgi:hypothetical protein
VLTLSTTTMGLYAVKRPISLVKLPLFGPLLPAAPMSFQNKGSQVEGLKRLMAKFFSWHISAN